MSSLTPTPTPAVLAERLAPIKTVTHLKKARIQFIREDMDGDRVEAAKVWLAAADELDNAGEKDAASRLRANPVPTDLGGRPRRDGARPAGPAAPRDRRGRRVGLPEFNVYATDEIVAGLNARAADPDVSSRNALVLRYLEEGLTRDAKAAKRKTVAAG
jgi:hypothetical protein